MKTHERLYLKLKELAGKSGKVSGIGKTEIAAMIYTSSIDIALDKLVKMKLIKIEKNDYTKRANTYIILKK